MGPTSQITLCARLTGSSSKHTEQPRLLPWAHDTVLLLSTSNKERVSLLVFLVIMVSMVFMVFMVFMVSMVILVIIFQFQLSLLEIQQASTNAS